MSALNDFEAQPSGAPVRTGTLGLFAVVAGDAVLVEDRLDQPRVAEGLGAVRPRCDRGGRTPDGQRLGARRLLLHAVLVAADAGLCLAGLQIHEAAHGLDGASLRVERLKVDRGASGRFEVGGAIRLDGHGAKHLAARAPSRRRLSGYRCAAWF
jgi:hypothetical protein